ncbi:MAG: dockerin type I domain-containing protein, partial [Ignavibacteria bacterium]
WSPTNIFINSTGNVSLANNLSFGAANVVNFTINAGGTLNPNTRIATFNGTAATVNFRATNLSTTINSGIFQTQGTVDLNIENGASFNSPLKVNTGTTTGYSGPGPYVGITRASVTVDIGATLNVLGGGFGFRTFGAVTNNGTVGVGSGSFFYMKGNSYVNNGTTSGSNFNFDTTTSISGTGTWAPNNIFINSTGNVSLANNLSFGASSVVNFTINAGGTLNPNTRIATFNGTSATVNFRATNLSTTINSGIFQTQGTVDLNIENGASFNSPLKVNTGTTTGYSNPGPYIGIIRSPITVDLGATLNVRAGGYGFRTFGTVTNNGTVGVGSGSTFYMKGNSYANNGTTSGNTFNFDTTTSISGTGIWAPTNTFITDLGNLSLANSLTFGGSSSQNFTVNSNGILNPNSNTATFFVASGTLYFQLASSATVPNSGQFQTRGSVDFNLQTGSSFNAPLKVNTGITDSYSANSPFAAIYNNKITVDTGATFNVKGGGYTVIANDSVINNGTIGGSGSSFRYFGNGFINNGIVNPSNFYFEALSTAPTSFHSLSGSGSFNTSNCNITPSAYVTMLSNHTFAFLNINNGGSLDITSRVLRLKGAGIPITVDGTLNTTLSTIEYNGTAAQTVAFVNIDYVNLTINDTAGVTLANNLYLPGVLTVSNGDLNLNGRIISLLPNATLVETNGNTVTGTSGYITATRNLNAPIALNVAGLGASITSSANLGLTQIKRGHTVQTLAPGHQSIKRFFTFDPQNNSDLNATLVFKYDDSEINGLTESGLQLFKSTNAGTNYLCDGGTVNTSANTITRTGINSLARYTAGNAGCINIKMAIEGFYNPTLNKLNFSDTVRAYLTNNVSPFNIIDSAIAILDATTFIAPFEFFTATSGNYYLVVKHRNSIETWSKTPQAFVYGGILNYDFTTAATQAFGNNMIQVDSAPVRFGIYSGDVNQDGVVDGIDLGRVDNDASNFVSGYVATDVNGDFIVDGTDFAIVDNNAANFVTKVTP